MDQSEHTRLCDEVITLIGPPEESTEEEVFHRVGEVCSDLLATDVELRVISLGVPGLTGHGFRRPDGMLLICCAAPCTWRDRLTALLHHLSHYLLGHQSLAPAFGDDIHRVVPHLPVNLVRQIAPDAGLTPWQEQEAETLTTRLLTRLTNDRHLPATPALPVSRPA